MDNSGNVTPSVSGDPVHLGMNTAVVSSPNPVPASPLAGPMSPMTPMTPTVRLVTHRVEACGGSYVLVPVAQSPAILTSTSGFASAFNPGSIFSPTGNGNVFQFPSPLPVQNPANTGSSRPPTIFPFPPSPVASGASPGCPLPAPEMMPTPNLAEPGPPVLPNGK